jgi:hypothetical protein
MELPRRILVILEREGLANDATALILYRFAVAAVALRAFSSIELLFSKPKSLLVRRRNEPPTLSGSGSENFSAASLRNHAPTTSVTPVTLKHDRKMS